MNAFWKFGFALLTSARSLVTEFGNGDSRLFLRFLAVIGVPASGYRNASAGIGVPLPCSGNAARAGAEGEVREGYSRKFAFRPASGNALRKFWRSRPRAAKGGACARRTGARLRWFSKRFLRLEIQLLRSRGISQNFGFALLECEFGLTASRFRRAKSPSGSAFP